MPPQNVDDQANQPVVGPTPGQQFQPAAQTAVPQPDAQPIEPAPQAQASWPPTDQQPYFTPPKKSGKKKFVVLALVLGVVLAVVGSVYVFAFYIPNRPENVWNSGINRSGQALQSLAEKSTEQLKSETYAKSEVTVDVTASAQGQNFSGSVTGKFDKTGSNSVLVLKSDSDQLKLNLSADVISKIAEGQQLPDSYVRIKGIKQIAALGMLPHAFAKFDNTWIAIEADYLKSVLSPEDSEEAEQEPLTSDDYSELVNAALTPTLDRVFSTDPSKAVFENREFIGKEEVDGKSAYHYKVGINGANYVSYCKALAESVMSTNAFAKTPVADKENLPAQKENAQQSCESLDENITEQDTFDLWIDSKQKVIYKVRITNEDQPGSYVDIGQNYDGGDTIEFFANYHDDSSQTDANFTLSTNLKEGNATPVADRWSPQIMLGMPVLIPESYVADSGEIDTATPQPNIPIEKVLKTLGLN